MDSAPAVVSFTQGASMRLSHLGVITVTGPDAATFLHNQLTNAVEGMGTDAARLAGYCSAKGRLLGIFLMWRAGETFFLVTPLEIVSALAKRLSMFVLRAKVRVEDASASTALYGLTGPRTSLGSIDALFDSGLPDVPYAMVSSTLGTAIRLPEAQQLPRWLVAARRDDASALDGATAELAQADASFWRWLEIRAAMPSIVLSTQDRFVPQMVNLEVLGGVNFSKGCYPGQEVVARSQYLAKLRRRMGLASAVGAELPAPGCDVLQSDRPGEAVGSVVSAERAPSGEADLLVVLPLDLLEAETLHLGTPDGPLLTLAPLPYALPANEVFVRPRL